MNLFDVKPCYKRMRICFCSVVLAFIGAHTLVWTHRVVEHLSGPDKGKTSCEDAFHLCSLKRDGYTANAFAESGMDNCQDFKKRLQANPKEVFRMATQRTGRKINGQN